MGVISLGTCGYSVGAVNKHGSLWLRHTEDKFQAGGYRGISAGQMSSSTPHSPDPVDIGTVLLAARTTRRPLGARGRRLAGAAAPVASAEG